MKILAIDGGGIRGIFSAQILKSLEEELGHPLAEEFDMVCGTSAGSIIGSAVACQKSMSEIADLFVERAEDIFSRQSNLGLIRSFYENDHFQQLLQDYFGNVRLEDIHMPLLIPAVDMSRGGMHIFKSGLPSAPSKSSESSSGALSSSVEKSFAKDGLKEAGGNIHLWDAILSSCSAPIYFPPNNLDDRYLTTDGGLYANNPSLLGLTEAIHEYEQGLEDVQILSIGTGQQKITFDVQEHEHPWGLLKWTKFKFIPFAVSPQLVDLAVTLSSDSISYHCQILCKDNFLRINKKMEKVVAIDDLEHVQYLLAEGKSVFQEQRQQILEFLR